MRLEVRDLCFAYGKGDKLLKNVCFTLKKGEIFSILGPNGAGKSTLLNCIMNLLTPESGLIRVHGQPLASMDVREIAKTIGYVPQPHSLVYDYSVRDFVVMGRTPYLTAFQQPGAQDYAQVDSVLEQLGIAGLSERPYTALSGGERQQVAIARTLVQRTQIIILDEPTSYLDYGNQIRVLQLIKSLAEDGYSIIMTTHMPDHALRLGGKTGILDRGGQFSVGKTEEILTQERLSNLYASDICILYVEELGRSICAAAQ